MSARLTVTSCDKVVGQMSGQVVKLANKVAVVEGFVMVAEQAEWLQGSALGQQYPLY